MGAGALTSPVAELLEELQRSGVRLKASDGEVLYSPRSAMTPELLSSLSDRKAELLATLASRSIPPEIVDGCSAHAIAAASVAERWTEVLRLDLRPGHCACCGGPALPWTLVCRWCQNLNSERRAELTEPRPCILCGSDGYTSGANGWLCEGCWRVAR